MSMPAGWYDDGSGRQRWERRLCCCSAADRAVRAERERLRGGHDGAALVA
ncbi:hypothetical protein [Microbacterium sp. Root553]|nr:hypothetical protein [Microbacterium sp. Root553]